MIPLHPTECRRCGERLNGTDAEPLRHQVWELPKIEPIITEYQRHRLTCECCGTVTCAERPSGKQDLRLLAHVLIRLKDDANALGLLEEVVHPGFFDDEIKSLIDCAQRLERHDLLLRLCQELREAGTTDNQLHRLRPRAFAMAAWVKPRDFR